MSERILGLDIGISSLGWALVDYDKENSLNNKIIKSGVRIFTIAENPKTGESLALPRRLARGARRINKRKKQRVKAIKSLFIKYLNLSKDELFGEDNIFNGKKQKDVWQLRDKALKRELTNVEFARVLTHIAKRRGYKSNRKVDELGNSDGKKVLSAIEENKKLLDGYTTIGQAIYQSTKETHIRRNKKDDYNHSVSRDMLVDEINIIFEKQKEFNNTFLNDIFKDEYLELFLNQRDFASVDEMVGFCTLEGVSEKRAAKRAYSAEEFVTITKLINTKIIDKDGKERAFTKEELQKIIELCKQEVKPKAQIGKPSYLKIKELLALDENDHFKGIEFYQIDKKTGEYTNKPTLFESGFIGFHKLRESIQKSLSKTHWQNISNDTKLLNDIAIVFSYHKSDEKIKNELEKLEYKFLTEEEKSILINSLVENISFDKFLNISIKAIENILGFMRDGYRYDEAVEKCKYKKIDGKKQKFLRALNKNEQLELTNPVVKRAIAQSRKVINALIREYGEFDRVHIELTREIKKSHGDRNKIKQGQEEYQKEKKEVVEHFIENYEREPKGNELLKFRLWKEQNELCAYSGEHINTKRLINDYNYAQIDHILPFSRSLEDGMYNKVLCLSKENQDKKDRTPFEYFTSIGRDWNKYEVFVKNILKNIRKSKRDRLLKKNFDESSEKAFRERNANDTAYMARFIKNFIEDNLELKGKGNCVLTRSGTLTSMLRHNWGVGNKSRNNHLHHAVDAIIVAFSTQSEVQRLSTLSAKIKEFQYKNSEEKARLFKFQAPIEHFRDEVQKSIDDIFVSFAPRKGVTGAAHKETIYSKKLEKQKGSFEVNGGLAENGEVKRLDIFKKDEKYHFVFLYSSDFLKDNLPNKTIKNILVDDSFKFVFSLFKDEFIEIKQKGKDKIKGYFKFCLSDGRFAICDHIDAKFNPTNHRYSTGSLEYIKKYQVDPLENKNEVKKEIRLGTKKQINKKR